MCVVILVSGNQIYIGGEVSMGLPVYICGDVSIGLPNVYMW
jgi:hypothetical protein